MLQNNNSLRGISLLNSLTENYWKFSSDLLKCKIKQKQNVLNKCNSATLQKR